jgi:hypothetical protein
MKLTVAYGALSLSAAVRHSHEQMRALFVVGALLLAVSARPLWLMWREANVGAEVNGRYVVERLISHERGMEGGALRGTVGGHTVVLEDDQRFQENGDVRVDGLVRILVDGKDYSSQASVKIRLSRRDANRYWGFVYLMKLVDHQEGGDALVVAQNLERAGFRTVSVSGSGRVVEDQFDYAGRCSPPVRALLIRSVVPHPSGFCSDVMQVWPSILYPVLYPWASGALGIVCLGIAGMLRLKRRAVRA